MKKTILLVTAAILIMWLPGGVFGNELAWEEIGRENRDVRTVLVCPDNPLVIYMGTGKEILKTEDGGRNYRSIFSVRGQNKAVNLLAADPYNKNGVYAATGEGFFFSNNQGKDWNNIFKGRNYFERECAAFAILPNKVYLGTSAGLFESSDKGRRWQKEMGELGKSKILAIASDPKDPGCIYVASVDGVFAKKSLDKPWERIYVAHAVEDGDDIEIKDDDYDGGERFSEVRYISLDSNNRFLYLATKDGVYKSSDAGLSWQPVTDYGLLNHDVKFLLASGESGLYAVTKSGIFRFGNERWQELSFQLPVAGTRFIAVDGQDNLYAACDKGLFRAKLEHIKDNAALQIKESYFKDAPDIRQVQQAAIKYAEVQPQKIINWRRQAAVKACLPEVSVGINRDTGDLWHWESGSSTKLEDDILRPGRDSIGWDVNLKWDLSDLVFNDLQTSIDVRSRLMVQLRDDVLDEVTKLYFERIRVKAELDNLDIIDKKKRFEKELKVAELTASLDGLTGGFFSHPRN